MPMTMEEYLAKHPVEQEQVEAHKRRMLTEVRGHRLRELRENAGLTQEQLAKRIGVGHRQVSRIERGDLEYVRIGTLRDYVQATGAELAVEHAMGDVRTRIA